MSVLKLGNSCTTGEVFQRLQFLATTGVVEEGGYARSSRENCNGTERNVSRGLWGLAGKVDTFSGQNTFVLLTFDYWLEI